MYDKWLHNKTVFLKYYLEKKIKNIIIQELKNENKSTVKETEKKILDENICIKKPVNENNQKKSLIICEYCGKRGHIQYRVW
jgi:hypothetical protein